MKYTSGTRLPKASACLLFAFAILVQLATAQADKVYSRHDIVGVWSGTNPAGETISYAFDADGSAAIYENGKSVLEGGKHSRVEWSLRRFKKFDKLDIVYSDLGGTSVTARYLVKWADDGSIVLRSGGSGGQRPASAGRSGDAMRIRLTR